MGGRPEEIQIEMVLCATSGDGVYYEVMKDNRGIRRFIWEHLNDVNRVLH